MKRLVKFIISTAIGLLLLSSTSNAQIQLGSTDVNGNLEVTAAFTFGGGAATIMVTGDSIATVEFMRTLMASLYEPIFTVSADSTPIIKNIDNSYVGAELVQVTENSADLIVTPGTGWPDLDTNNIGYYYNQDSLAWYLIMDSNDTIQKAWEADYTVTP